ncbi:MAG: selenium cofactor biosynthesis protein YqeC [Anaerolineaceae bacterium]
MDLFKALRIQADESIAFVGAGGKTSAIFTIARQVGSPVVITTTTHLFEYQSIMGDNRWSPTDRKVFDKIKSEILKGGVHVFTGETSENERVGGLPGDVLEDVRDFCKEKRIPLLIEADGSKTLPAKAPGSHEPVIPEWIDKVVVCCGLNAIGARLDAEHVHRPEIFSKITGATMGYPLTYNHLERELLSEDGGLKNIPPRARRIVLINQADTPERQSGVQEISGGLLKKYDGVIISKSTGLAPRGYNILDALSVQEKSAGIILAAGKSSRMGDSGEVKQLLDWHGKPFLWHIVHAALRAELDPVIVVTGSEGKRILQALLDLPVTIVNNPNWERGQSTSVRAGVEALPDSVGSAVFLMSDQPQIHSTLIQSLIEKHSQNLPAIVAPLIDGTRGNPVLFDRIAFEELKRLQGDTGGRGVFSKFPIEWLPWSDASMLMDVDTPEDYQRLLRMGEE